ncbi:InlB B-repeat-containing protein [Peristeroidobacter soli]|uniref:InlB B-repeat-containing protein n=1 Tax=Peristeroidobacter soli TaxID=2497877 RepID=UPI00101D227C|nr:outer membrane beta-barrel protein [Peristeroidobacter soli]
MDRKTHLAYIRRTNVTFATWLRFLFGALLLTMFAARLQAASIQVTSTADSGAGTLRQALTNAADGDTIYFAAGLNGQTIVLASDINLSGKSVTVDAMALATGVTIDAVNAYTLTFTGADRTLRFRGVNFYRWRMVGNPQTLIVLDYCNFTGTARNLLYGWGGVLYSAGNVTIRNSSFYDNHMTQTQGGVLGFGEEGTVNITNTTFYNNSSTLSFGGAIYIQSPKKLVYISHSAFINNSMTGSSTSAGGAFRMDGSKAFIRNTIFWGNSDEPAGIGTDNFSVNSGSVVSQGYNIIASGTGITLAPTDITGNPALGALALNSARTYTSVPGDNGSADLTRIPAGTNGCSTTPDIDQRGLARGQGTGGSCTIGPIELNLSGSAASSVPRNRTLSVLSDTSSGTVVSSPAGINCGSTCSVSTTEQTATTLTATPNASIYTVRWTGCDYIPSTNVCVVTPTFGDSDITARFSGTALDYNNLTFDEGAANDGSVTGSAVITLFGDTFTGNNGDNLVALSKVTFTNVPAGLTPVVTRNSATQATLTFTGNATARTAAASVPNVGVAFQNSAFTGNVAANVANSTRSDISIRFSDPNLSYSPLLVSESSSNDGSVLETINVTLFGDTFVSNLAGLYTPANVPAGLTMVVERNSATQATIYFTGNAAAHADANTVSNVRVTFANGAFTGGSAAGITQSTSPNLTIRFSTSTPTALRSLAYSQTAFSEAPANNGTIVDTATLALYGDQFTGVTGEDLVDTGKVLVTNVPAGLTVRVRRAGITTATLSFAGAATNHTAANSIANLGIIFLDKAFVGDDASLVSNTVRSDLAINFLNPPFFVVSTSISGDGSISPSSANVVPGNTQAFTVTPNTGSSIGTVTGCAGSLVGNTYTTGPINAACTVNATFTTNNYTVTATAGTGGTISPGSTTLPYGNATSFTVTPNIGYSINTVTGCNGSLVGNTYTTDIIVADCAVNATFSINTFTVTANAGTGGTISPSSNVVNYGDVTSFTVTPSTGYSIGTVTGCGGSLAGNTYTTGTITGACAVSASFTLNSYTVTASAGTGGTITPPSTPVNHGSTTSFTVTPSTGYSIGTVTGCGGSLAGSTYTTGTITGACSVSATFTLNSYTVTSSAGTGGTITPPSTPVNHGSTTSFTVTPTTGYSIGTVTGCGGSLAGNTYTTGAITGACAVSATFTLNSYTVTASAGTGGTITPPSTPVNHGSTTSFTVTPTTGYSIGTVTGCGGSLAGNTYTTGTITGACAVSATFTLNSYTVTASAGTGGTITPPSTPVNHGSTTSFTVTPDTGYSIGTVTGCGGSLAGNTYTTGTITGACAVSATFTLNSYTVTASAGTGGTITPPSTPVNHGSTTSFTVTPSTGYSIGTVTGCGGSLAGNTYTTGTITGTCTVNATFTLNSYTVSASAGTGGSITPANSSVSHGSTTNFTVTPSTGYSIGTVSGCGGSLAGNTYTTGTITGTCSVNATFTLNSYTVSAAAGTGGTITPPSSSVSYGSTINFTVTPDTGYSIASVTGCGGSLAGNTFTTDTITGACSISAAFVLNSYAVTATPGPGGSISPASVPVNFGTTATFTVTPDTGYSIDSVTGCGGSLSGNSFTTDTITGACAISATFSLNSYAITASAGTGGTITPSSTPVNYGSTTSFTVTPDTGYDIDTVTGCGGSLSGNTFTTDTITGACAVNATFVLKTYPLNSVVAGGNGTVTPTNITATHGDNIAFTLTPDTGYSIGMISGCDGTLIGNTYTTDPVTGPCTVAVSYTLDTHPITATAEEHGSISPTNVTAGYGSEHTFIITPESGYYISTVTGCGGTLDGDEYTTAPITGACAITASFTQILHMVSATAGVGGTISPSETPVPEGATTVFTVTPNAGYGIESVTGCDGGFDGDVYRTGPIMDQCAVTATFTQNTYDVQASSVGSGTVSPTQSTIIHGDNATFRLSPMQGYGIGEITATGCSGTLNEDDTYVTAPITSPCQITVSFIPTADVVVTSRGGGGSFEWLTMGVLLMFVLIRRRSRFGPPLALVVCLLATQAQAQDRDWSVVYFGGQLGRASTDIDSEQVAARMAEQGIPGTPTVDGADRKAWRLFGGYRFNDWLAVEAGYVNLDKITTKLTGIGAVQFSDIRDVLPISGDGGEVKMLLSYSFASRFRVHAQAGAWRWSSKYKVTTVDGGSTNHKIDGVDMTYGAGIEAAINRKWRARLTWDNYKTDDEDASVYMIGLIRELR